MYAKKRKVLSSKLTVCVCGSVTERASGRVRGGLQLIAYIHIHIYATLCTVNVAAAALLLRRRRLSAATAADYMASLLYGGVCIGIGNRAELTVPHMTHTHTHTKGRHKHCLIIVEHTLCI